jgi:hypothetical protein
MKKMEDNYVVVVPTCFVSKVFQEQPCMCCLRDLFKHDLHTVAVKFKVCKKTHPVYRLWVDVGYVCSKCHTDDLKILLEMDFFAFIKMVDAFLQDDVKKLEKTGSAKAFLAKLISVSSRYYGNVMKNVSKQVPCSCCTAKKPKNRCKGCMSAKYCGDDCAKKHWKEHKPVCMWIRKKQSFFLPTRKLEL